jgi:hypothetical protein
MKWLYKATGSKLDYEGTRRLAEDHGFLARSAYDDDGSWASNVRYVAPGDELHVYYVEGEHVREVGSYEVIDRAEHSTPGLFGEGVPETALFNVDEPGFIAAVDKDGAYKPDPVTARFTGWPLRRLGTPIPYDPSMFPAENTLMRNGRASAARPRQRGCSRKMTRRSKVGAMRTLERSTPTFTAPKPGPTPHTSSCIEPLVGLGLAELPLRHRNLEPASTRSSLPTRSKTWWHGRRSAVPRHCRFSAASHAFRWTTYEVNLSQRPTRMSSNDVFEP